MLTCFTKIPHTLDLDGEEPIYHNERTCTKLLAEVIRVLRQLLLTEDSSHYIQLAYV